MKAIRLTDETDWNGVLKNLPQQVSKIQNAYRIIALAQTNQLSSRLFDVRLPFRQSCEKSPFLIYSPDLYFYGAMPAMTTAFDMEKWTWMGETYKGLDLFVKTALIQEKWDLAKRYIDVMKQSFALKSRADNYEKYIGNKDLLLKENPDLRIIDEHRFKEDRTFSVMNHFPNQFLSYKDFPINNIERRLLADLYTKNLDLFLSDLKIAKQVYKSFPPYMQQALVVKAMEMKNPKVLQMIPVNRMEVERIQQFKKDVAKYGGRNFEKAASELYEQYANNYAYFYMFNNEDFSSSAIHYIKK